MFLIGIMVRGGSQTTIATTKFYSQELEGGGAHHVFS